MNAPNKSMHGWRLVLDYTPFPDLGKGLRGQWPTPRRPGIYRLDRPEQSASYPQPPPGDGQVGSGITNPHPPSAFRQPSS